MLVQPPGPDQEYVAPPEEVRAIVLPTHTGLLEPAVAVGTGLTVIVAEALPGQEPPVTVTEYVVVDVGETVMDCVVAPVLQENDDPAVAVSVALDPAQIVPSLAVPEVSVTEMDGVQPEEGQSTLKVCVTLPDVSGSSKR